MQLQVLVDGQLMVINVGSGSNNIRWLCLYASLKVAKSFHPYVFRVPLQATTHSGQILKPRAIIREVLKEFETMVILLSHPTNSEPVESILSRGWPKEAFGPESNLCSTDIQWKMDPGGTLSIPRGIRGTFYPSELSPDRYSFQKAPTSFDIPLQPVKDDATGEYAWVACLKSSPGVAHFTFVHGETGENFPLSNDVPCDQSEHVLTIETDLPNFIPMESCDDVDDYSVEFLTDWNSITTSNIDSGKLPLIKRALNEHFPELSLCFSLISLFHPGHERFISAEDLAYLLQLDSCEEIEKIIVLNQCLKNEEKKLSRAEMIGCIIRWVMMVEGRNSSEEFVQYFNKLISETVLNNDRVFRNKDFIDIPLFPSIIKKLRIVFSKGFSSSRNSDTVKALLEALYKMVTDPDDLTRVIISDLTISRDQVDSAIDMCGRTNWVPFLRFVEVLVIAFGLESIGRIASLLVAQTVM